MPAWTPAQIPDLTGKRFLVTGVTSGLGASIAHELASRGAEVVLAARSQAKLEATRQAIRAATPEARLSSLIVDLADLASVRRAAAQAGRLGAIDVLVNNAGVMATPHLRTADGFESQLATNHLGPFALTGLLLPQLVASGNGRVVNTGSQAHRMALASAVRDPRTQQGRYSKWQSYAQSKLADIQFTYGLDRRLKRADLPVIAVATHPGYSATGLMHGRNVGKKRVGPLTLGLERVFAALGQPAAMGALPTLMAATAAIPGGTYIGPDGPGQMRGQPRIVGSTRRSRDVVAQDRLWEISERATGVRYP